MVIVRPIRSRDIDNLLLLAKAAYPGMTTLPPELDVLEKKITRSTNSINKNVRSPGNEAYLMVMEDTETGQLVGTAGIFARLGEDDQFYSYKLNKVTQYSKPLDRKISLETLHLSNHFEGFAEVATLYLMDSHRVNGNGKLLARSRYLFMAEFRNRFPKKVMADLRGYFDEDGRSPFWEALGKHFFGMSYSHADYFGAVNGNQFISDLMPKHPIYVNLLPEDARAAIGRPNDAGKPALAMLEKEGFRFNGQIDIFDGAASVDTYIDDIASVKNSQVSTVVGELTTKGSGKYIVSGGNIKNFRVCVSDLEISPDGDAYIPNETQEALCLSLNDRIRFVAL